MAAFGGYGNDRTLKSDRKLGGEAGGDIGSYHLRHVQVNILLVSGSVVSCDLRTANLYQCMSSGKPVIFAKFQVRSSLE